MSSSEQPRRQAVAHFAGLLPNAVMVAGKPHQTMSNAIAHMQVLEPRARAAAQVEVRQQLLQLHDCTDLAAESLWDYVSTDDAWKEVLGSIEDFNAEWGDVKAISDRVKVGRNRAAESQNRIVQLWGQEAFDTLCPPPTTARYMKTLAM